MVAARARRDTCDLLVSLLSLNSAPLATCARTATRRRSLCRCGLRARKYPQPRCHTSSFASTAQRTSTRRQLPPPRRSGAPLAPCTGLASLKSLRTHSDAAAIAHSTPQPCHGQWWPKPDFVPHLRVTTAPENKFIMLSFFTFSRSRLTSNESL